MNDLYYSYKIPVLIQILSFPETEHSRKHPHLLKLMLVVLLELSCENNRPETGFVFFTYRTMLFHIQGYSK